MHLPWNADSRAYKANIEDKYSNLLFVRVDGNAAAYDWNENIGNIWNQSGDLTYDAAKPVYYITAFGDPVSLGEWHTMPFYYVTFKTYDASAVLKVEMVDKGGSATAPDAPERAGYTFAGWYPSDFSNVTEDITVVATYNEIPTYYYIAGSIAQLGNWTLTEANKMTENRGTTYTLTVENVELTTASPLLYKWVKKQGDTEDWQPGDNSSFTAPQDGVYTLEFVYTPGEAAAALTATKTSCDDEPITVTFKKPDNWDAVGLWAWTGTDPNVVNLFDAWPGIQLAANTEGLYEYTFNACIQNVNIIFNNFINGTGGKQSDNINNVTTSSCFQLGTTTNDKGWYDLDVCASTEPQDETRYTVPEIVDTMKLMTTSTTSGKRYYVKGVVLQNSVLENGVLSYVLVGEDDNVYVTNITDENGNPFTSAIVGRKDTVTVLANLFVEPVYEGIQVISYNYHLTDAQLIERKACAQYTVAVSVNDALMGSATVDNLAAVTVLDKDVVTLKAEANIGYDFSKWNDDITEASRQVIVTGDVTYTATFVPSPNTAYAVLHYLQNLDGSYPDTPTNTEYKTGTTGTQVTPDTKEYEGYTAPSTQTIIILANGSANVAYKYTRNSYMLTWDADGGQLSGEYTPAGMTLFGTALIAPTVRSLDGVMFLLLCLQPMLPIRHSGEILTIRLHGVLTV